MALAALLLFVELANSLVKVVAGLVKRFIGLFYLRVSYLQTIVVIPD